MHPTTSYELAKTRTADLRHQAQREARARTARTARRAPARLDTGHAQRQAPFASAPQRSDRPDADAVAEAIKAVVHCQ